MDPLFEYFLFLETCVPGGADGLAEIACPHCSATIELEVLDPSSTDRYRCCECAKEFEVDWAEGTMRW